MGNMVTNETYDRLRNDKVLGNWKSDKKKTHKKNKDNIHRGWGPFRVQNEVAYFSGPPCGLWQYNVYNLQSRGILDEQFLRRKRTLCPIHTADAT